MPKFVDYECEECGNVYEEIFNDTEPQPQVLEEVCTKCGGNMKRGLNLKNNCQIWRIVRDDNRF